MIFSYSSGCVYVGLVAFVVAVAAVADEVHEKVAAELRAVCDGDAHRDHARFGVVAVHVDHRHLESLREVARESASSGRRSGSVVNPTWLFTITCSVPPTRYARRRARLNVSATTPSPGNAASPWMQIGTTAILVAHRRRVRPSLMRARVALQTPG